MTRRRTKFVPYPQRELSREFVRFAESKARAIVILGVGVLAIGGVVTTLLVFFEPHGPMLWYLLGALHAMLLAMALGMVGLLFLASSSRGVTFLRGVLGEGNTKDFLDAAMRRTIWGYVAGVATAGGDIDHLVVTRRAGVLAVDSKWRNEVTPAGIEDMAGSARSAAKRAESIMRSEHVGVLKRERGVKHRSTDAP